MNKYIATFIILATLCFTGCFTTSANKINAKYHKHSLKTSVTDHYTSMRINQAIYLNNNEYNNTHISITTFNGIVLLTGQAPEKDQIAAIESIAKKSAPNSQIYNHIDLASPSSQIIRISDSWITTKVDSQIIAKTNINANQIKVITENGIVYLMGSIPQEQEKTIIKIARHTQGVQAVIKIFPHSKKRKLSRRKNLSAKKL